MVNNKKHKFCVVSMYCKLLCLTVLLLGKSNMFPLTDKSLKRRSKNKYHFHRTICQTINSP